MPQSKIREWIERIPHHIQEVIRCEGGNEYKEGRPNWMKSREIHQIIEVLEEEGIDLRSESGDSAPWQSSGVYSEDEELEREDIWAEEEEECLPQPEPEPTRPTRRSNRRKE
jgi:hypothetical protein